MNIYLGQNASVPPHVTGQEKKESLARRLAFCFFDILQPGQGGADKTIKACLSCVKPMECHTASFRFAARASFDVAAMAFRHPRRSIRQRVRARGLIISEAHDAPVKAPASLDR